MRNTGSKLHLHQESLRNLTMPQSAETLRSGQPTTFTKPVQVCDPVSFDCLNR
jgi:hypothetical protein